jgi:hypothetical protein
MLAQSSTISETEIQDLVRTWYHQLDIHAPLSDLTALLIEDGLRMVFPEMIAEGLSGFQQWYERVTHLFFDEVHTVKDIQCTSQPDRTFVKVVVKWEASRWIPPAPCSDRLVIDAFQTWEVVRSPIHHRPVVATYTVDALEYYDGSAEL